MWFLFLGKLLAFSVFLLTSLDNLSYLRITFLGGSLLGFLLSTLKVEDFNDCYKIKLSTLYFRSLDTVV